MKLWIYLAWFVLSPVVFALGVLLMIKLFGHKRANNTDVFLRVFVYRLTMTKDELYARLAIPNIYDVMEYNVDEKTEVITFLKYSVRYPYKLSVLERADGTILRVEAMKPLSRIAWSINDFFEKKLNAEPIPYTD